MAVMYEEEVRRRISIMQAYLDGQTIEIKGLDHDPDKWFPVTGCRFDNWDAYDYRVKPDDQIQYLEDHPNVAKMREVLLTDYLKNNVSASACVLRILDLYDQVSATDPEANKEATKEQIHAVNNLFLIKGWSSLCTVRKIIQEREKK